MDTIKATKYVVTQDEFKEILLYCIRPYIDSFESNISNLITEISTIGKNRRSIPILGKDLYWDTKACVLIPNLQIYEDVKVSIDQERMDEIVSGTKLLCDLPVDAPRQSQIRSMKEVLLDNYEADCSFLCVCDDNRQPNYLDIYGAYNPTEGKIHLSDDTECFFIPIINLSYANISYLVLRYFVEYGICPEGLSDEATHTLVSMVELLKIDKTAFDLVGNKVRYIGGEALVDLCIYNPEAEGLAEIRQDFVQILKQVCLKRHIGGYQMDTKEELLNCEKVRADIDPYEERLLSDLNRGHWDLWFDQDEKQFTVAVADEMYARNPISDINENGVIAIDFGTKSTVVVYQSGVDKSLPMGVGDGKLSKGPTPERYENPTVMHFVNLEQFLSDYSERKGRPKTKWNDLTISHTAMEQFSNSKSEEYYEYLHQIKQWAGDRKKQFNVKSNAGAVYTLPAFLDVKDEEWNPIEIYAYYLGLYINNMRKGHGIYLDYYLSFPVTYEKDIRKKIIECFARGIKKSLPESIQNNNEVMSRFHINGDISEPAAYAVCALQEYGFDPKGDEEVFYGIFDFGGGTTDFDFGIWKQSPKRRYDYTIENFGADGDKYLGGENLLEMLAFEVFKSNQDFMREKGYTFTLAPKCTEFLGSDSLLADSQEAEKNMHNLMKQLRPYWEKTNLSNEDDSAFEDIPTLIETILNTATALYDYKDIRVELEELLEKWENGVCDKDSVFENLANLIYQYNLNFDMSPFTSSTTETNDEIKLTVSLFDKDGKDTAETLVFSKAKLDEIIEARIREGVVNFFSALIHSYKNERVKKPTTVNILLAGNSCKSPIVRKVFDEEILKQEQLIREMYPDEKIPKDLFEIYPPLGTEEAYEKMESKGINVERNNFEKPTGKTGVAFGLIQCRAGGSIERITNIGIEDEIPFKYFIGWKTKGKFEFFRDDSKTTQYLGKPDYNVWYKFIEADEPIFELYYTSLPECINGNLVVDGNAAVRRLRCETIQDDVANVYIRAIDPHTIEYVVAKNDDVENSMVGDIVRKELDDEN